MTEHDLPFNHCPACGYKIDRCTSVYGNHGPEPGDFTVCLKCGDILAFNDNLTLRHLTSADTERLASAPNTLSAVTLAQQVIRKVRQKEATSWSTNRED